MLTTGYHRVVLLRQSSCQPRSGERLLHLPRLNITSWNDITAFEITMRYVSLFEVLNK